MTGRYKTWLRWLGLAIGGFGAIVLVDALDPDSIEHSLHRIGGFRLAAGAVIYGAALYLMLRAWRLALPLVGRERTPAWTTRLAMSRSVLAKYLPGNFFQFVSRQIDLARWGFSQLEIGLSSIKDAVSQLAAAGVLAALALWLAEDLDLWSARVSIGLGLPTQSSLALKALVSVGALAAFVLLSRLSRMRDALRMLLLHMAFFAIMGAIGAGLLGVMAPDKITVSLAVGTFMVAWIAGFVVIGAPGGLGVRELVIMAGTAPLVGQATAADAALIFRVLTILGDGVFAAAMYASILPAAGKSRTAATPRSDGG